MATTLLVSQSYGDVLLECGYGSPDHTSPIGSVYMDYDSPPKFYKNTDGATTWVELVDANVTALSSLITVGTLTTGNADAIVSAATTSLAGKLEIATAIETDSSTANRAMTPDLFKASDFGRSNVGIVLFGTETAVTVLAIGTDDLPSFPVPASMDGWELIDVLVVVTDKGVTGTTTVNANRRRAGANVAMLSTGVTLGDEWFAKDGTVNTSNDDLATGDEITPYVTGIHSGTAPNGLFVIYTFEQP